MNINGRLRMKDEIKGKACPVCKGEGYIYPNDAMKYDYSPSPNIKVLCNYCKGTRIAPTDPDITVRDAIEEKLSE